MTPITIRATVASMLPLAEQPGNTLADHSVAVTFQVDPDGNHPWAGGTGHAGITFAVNLSDEAADGLSHGTPVTITIGTD